MGVEKKESKKIRNGGEKRYKGEKKTGVVATGKFRAIN